MMLMFQQECHLMWYSGKQFNTATTNENLLVFRFSSIFIILKVNFAISLLVYTNTLYSCKFFNSPFSHCASWIVK